MNAHYLRSLASSLAVVLLFTACGSEAVNEPGEDIEAPTVQLLTPASGDTIRSDDMQVTLSASDNVGVQMILLYLNNVPFDTLTNEPYERSVKTDVLVDGEYTLSAVAFDATGNRSAPSIVPFVFGAGSGGNDDVKRIALAEIVTSANCSPCGPQNEQFHQLTEPALYEERLAVIKYHIDFPRPTDKLWTESKTWSSPRVDWLFNFVQNDKSAPNGWVDGAKIGNRATDWFAAVNADLSTAAGAKIDLAMVDNGETITLNITVKGINTSDFNDLRLHTVVTESDIEYNDGNSENIHYDVMRQMYPDANGEALAIPNGQQLFFQRQVTVQPFWNRDHLKAVVFLQSSSTKEVLQAAKIDL